VTGDEQVRARIRQISQPRQAVELTEEESWQLLGSTLRTHLRAIYHKLGAESRDDAVIRAREPTCGVTSSAGRPAS
jgi:hypothetical protein